MKKPTTNHYSLLKIQNKLYYTEPSPHPTWTSESSAITEDELLLAVEQHDIWMKYKKEEIENEEDKNILTNVLFTPYKLQSKTYKELKKRLKGRNLHEEDGNISGKLVINWGLSKKPIGFNLKENTLLNKYTAVAKSRDKYRAFQCMKDTVQIPQFTTSLDQALKWVEDGHTVFGRKKTGYGGRDIVKHTDFKQFCDRNFFTKYIPKKDEFRVHIGDGEIFDYQRKALRKIDDFGKAINPDDVDFQIRNLYNGFIYARSNVNLPEDVKVQALAAMKALKLDFGAVDVIYNQHYDKAYVLEINTAPGLTGTTLENYLKYFEKHIDKVGQV